MASREFFPLFAFRRQREVHHHDRIFFHDADEQQNADDRDDAQIRFKNQQRQHPRPRRPTAASKES